MSASLSWAEAPEYSRMGRQMKFADWLWFIAVIVALFSPAIVGILHHT